MRNHFVVRHFILPLVCLLLFIRVDAKSADSINSLVEQLIVKDFKSIKTNYQDSVTVNIYLKKATRYTGARNDSAFIFAGKAIILAEKAGLIPSVSVALQKMGQIFMLKENFGEATSCFINALKIEEKRNDEKRIADLNDELGGVYFYQEIFGKALDYHTKALEIYTTRIDTSGMIKTLSHLGSLYNSHEYCEKRSPEQTKNDYETALKYYNKSLNLCKLQRFQEGIIHSWLNIGNVYRRMGQSEKALGFVQKSLDYYRSTNDSESISSTNYTMGYIYNSLKKYDLALACFNISKGIDLRNKYTGGIQFLYEAIAQTYDNLKDYKNSRDYYVKYMILRDSIYNNEKSKQIFELETKYKAEKKQAEIERLILVKKQGTLVIYIMIALLMLVSVFSWAYYRNIRNKKIIADQKLEIKEKQLLELVKDRQLTAAKSVLQGEEAERSRLAGDLHDGLGGLLTGVKLKLSSMKENAIITSKNLANFNHALDLLDTSISELRRVAHNLMPETLIHYGLRTALNDFIKQIEPEGLPILRFNTFGEDIRYNKEIEITVYRISQELVTNAIKHAQAKLIDIQLFTENGRICVQIIDNGIGFDPESLDPEKTGKGLKNIRDRVTAFNGRFEIISQRGKGTESTIEFLIP
jgi:two-component system NarL family sensor kinase